MIKDFKKSSYKISASTMLSCIIAITTVFTNGVIAKGVEVNNAVTTSSSNAVNTNDEHEFIIDAPIKFYDDIKKVQKIVNFKFKLPDYLPESNKVDDFQIRKLSEKDDDLEMYFANTDGKFSFVVSEQDPVETLKKIECEKIKAIDNSKVESEKSPLKIGEIKGLNVILTTTLPAREIGNDYSKESKKVTKYFIWKDEGLWYSVEYNSTSKSEESSNDCVNFSQDIIEKIAESIKYPKEVSNVDYSVRKDVSAEIQSIDIYDKDDLEKAKNLLGFNPKFPLKINEDINITGSMVSISGDSNTKNNEIDYELNNYYANKNGSITFIAQKSSKIYENIMKNGTIEENKVEQAQVEKLNINNIEVFKYSSKGVVPQINYIWKENNVYYTITFFVNIENSDDIVKSFVNSKPIE